MAVSRKLALGLAGALFAVGGVGVGLAVATHASGTAPTNAAYSAASGTTATPPTWMTSYAGYSGMMSRDGVPGAAPGTGAWPGAMMGGGYGMRGGTGMGAIMGRVLASAPGPRVSAAQGAADANAVPPGASVDAAHKRLTFTGGTVTLTLVAGPDESNTDIFQTAGLSNPEIVVPPGARVTLRLVNADTDAAHGLVITAAGAAQSSWMPMMSATAAFPGAATWALGAAGSSGAPVRDTSFTAATPGTYTYLCPVPGHAQQGMYGAFTVR